MAKSVQTDVGPIYRPGAYARYSVASSPTGLATTGVLMLVGEALGGPDFTQEADLELTAAFGPDAFGEVQAKYQGGPLVDAFRSAIAASNDPRLVGSFQRAVIVKTNSGTKASAALTQLVGSGAYVSVFDKNFGPRGNQTQIAVSSAQAEVVPSTGLYTYIPAVGTVNVAFRVNGGTQATVSIAANRAPNDFVTDVDAATGVDASGGANRGVLTVAGTVAVGGVAGNSATFTRSVNWAVTPSVGDTMIIPMTAPAGLRGASDVNVGAYVITAATATVISATKLSDAGRTGAAIGVISAPVATAAVTIAAITDLTAWAPVAVFQAAGPVLTGAGKALEFAQLTTGTDLLERTAFTLGTVTPVSWVSKVAAPALITSAAESRVTLSASRAGDGINESYVAGGEIPLRVGHTGANTTLTITATALTTSAGLNVPLSNFANVQELANYINAQPGYSASTGTASLGLLPVTSLDRVTAIGIANQFGNVQPGRVKVDAYRLFTDLSGSALVQFNNPASRAAAGLPAITPVTYLAGGTQGGTSNAQFSAALTKLEGIQGNFLVPLFARDATADIVDENTDASSTYTIAGINAAARAHVLAMADIRRRKNRQAIVALQDTFVNQQTASANQASFRVNMSFENVTDIDSNGNLKVFQPWMASVKAAAMQAAGFYRPITNKLIAINGVSHAAGDFNFRSDSDMTAALRAGLMPIKAARTGGFAWESDQTTYGRDDNFVFNSLQAVYTADTVAMSTAQLMEDAFVGESTADVSANIALTYLDQIMAQFFRLKLIVASDDAPKGYKNAQIRISGNVMYVKLEIKLATGLDFILIDFLVSKTEQTAS